MEARQLLPVICLLFVAVSIVGILVASVHDSLIEDRKKFEKFSERLAKLEGKK